MYSARPERGADVGEGIADAQALTISELIHLGTGNGNNPRKGWYESEDLMGFRITKTSC